MSRVVKNSDFLPWIFIAFSMLCASYAAVPLYNIFCKATGFGGTTQEAVVCPESVGSRTFKIRFNADTDTNLPWKFFTDSSKNVEVLTGQCTLSWYYAKNLSNEATKGIAVYNVSPLKAGKYFRKVDCFCFREQVLHPGQKVSMPVLFYIDPEIENDPEMDDLRTITLSYRFYPFKENFYDSWISKYSYR